MQYKTWWKPSSWEKTNFVSGTVQEGNVFSNKHLRVRIKNAYLTLSPFTISLHFLQNGCTEGSLCKDKGQQTSKIELKLD